MSNLGRPCTICGHSRREELEAALANGEALRKLASRFSVSDAAIRRHRDAGHMTPKPVEDDAAPVAEADSAGIPRKTGEVINHVRKALGKCWGLYDKAERKRDGGREAMAALREIIRQAELLGKVTGEIGPNAITVVNIAQSQQFIEVQSLVLGALVNHPAALVDVRRAFGLVIEGEVSG
jgi:hypothetical protein